MSYYGPPQGYPQDCGPYSQYAQFTVDDDEVPPAQDWATDQGVMSAAQEAQQLEPVQAINCFEAKYAQDQQIDGNHIKNKEGNYDQPFKYDTPIIGNQYVCFTFGLHKKMHCQQKVAAFAIFVIQLVAPVAIIVYGFNGIVWNTLYKESLRTEVASSDGPATYIFTKVLALCFFLGVTIWAYYTLESESLEWSKTRFMAECFAHPCNTEVASMADVGEPIDHSSYINWSMIQMNAFMNTFVVVVSIYGLAMMFAIADNPKDVIFDSLGLTFLVNLDNIDGALGVFGATIWKSNTMGKMFYGMLVEKMAENGLKKDADEAVDDYFMESEWSKRHAFFRIGQMFLIVAVIFFLVLFFGCPEEYNAPVKELDLQTALQKLQRNLTSAVP